MATDDLARGDRPGNPADLSSLLSFDRVALAVVQRPDLGAIEIKVRDRGHRPVAILLAPRQAHALAALLICASDGVAPAGEG